MKECIKSAMIYSLPCFLYRSYNTPHMQGCVNAFASWYKTDLPVYQHVFSSVISPFASVCELHEPYTLLLSSVLAT